jgi:tetratricopeptide (TPR) repeat protein
MITTEQTPDFDRHLATELWREGLDRQLAGELDEAMSLYRCSLDLHETAEAHTFLGWGLSFQGRLDDAIDQCRHAIRTDPELGNPYNDIGAYLVELDREEEAILWFERAKEARRYENPQFPYLNLARIWIGRTQYGRALLELQVAEVLAPEDRRVAQLIDRIGELLLDAEAWVFEADDVAAA